MESLLHFKRLSLNIQGKYLSPLILPGLFNASSPSQSSIILIVFSPSRWAWSLDLSFRADCAFLVFNANNGNFCRSKPPGRSFENGIIRRCGDDDVECRVHLSDQVLDPVFPLHHHLFANLTKPGVVRHVVRDHFPCFHDGLPHLTECVGNLPCWQGEV